MTITLETPDADGLDEVLDTLRQWQDDSPVQLHPGDLGWSWQYGADTLAAAIRTWTRDGDVVAVAMVDSPEVLRLTVAPAVRRDEDLARRLVADIGDPARGVLPAGEVAVESPDGTTVQEVLTASGWDLGEAWTPLRRDLSRPVPDPGLRTEEVGPALAADYAAIHRSAFRSTRFTPDLWRTMSTGAPYADARSLLGFDDADVPVAVVTVWSAGPGRPGLLEPMGVHADHTRRGHGRAITMAAARTLRDLGSSCAVVCTPSARVPAVATYEAAGFERLPERLDRSRPA